MKKIWKILCIVGLSAILVGGVVVGVGALAAKGDMAALSYLTVEQKTYVESGTTPVTSVNLDFKDTDVDLIFSDEAESVSVSYPQKMTKSGKEASVVFVTEVDGALRITEKTNWKRTWLAWDFIEEKAVITLPSERTYSLKVDVDNGDVKVLGNAKTGSLSISTDNGDVIAKNAKIVAETLRVESDNGDLELSSFTAKNVTIETDNGDVTIGNGTVSEKTSISLDNGRVAINGTLVSNRIEIDTDNGGVYATNGVLDGKNISLETDNGNIKINVAGAQSEYSVYVEKENGNSNVSSMPGGEKRLELSVDNGDIYVTFQG
ncbi:MAG: DUF4097 family beta strand repeat protein [Clostridia bacterium]|nr:DUF4097 family beta strand repeat protein [Clostridia bacterium]